MGKLVKPLLSIAAVAAGAWVAGPLLGLSGLGALAARTVVAMGVQSLGSKILGSNRPDTAGATDTPAASPILANEASSVASVPIIYGRRLVGSKRIYLNVSNNNNDLHVIYALSEGQIGAIRKVYINDELAIDFTIASPSNSGTVANGETISGTANVIVPKYQNKLIMNYKLGSSTQTAFSTPFAEWNTNAKAKGVSLLYMTYIFDREVYTAIPTITVEIDGKLVRRADALGTTYSVYTHPTYTTSFGANPADVLLDYLTDPIYGKALSDSEIDFASFIDARTYCFTVVQSTFGTTLDPILRYTTNGHINPDDTIYDNVRRILATCNGYLIFSNGRYVLKLNRERTTAEQTLSNLYAIDEDNLIGTYDVQLGSKQSRFNRVKMNYFDSTLKYNANIIYLADGTYLARDNGQVLEREVDLSMTTDSRNATLISRIILRQSRYTMSINFTTSFTALQVEVGDIIRISLVNMGFTNKLFRVMAMTINLDSTIQISAMEYDDSIYTITGEPLPEIPLPGTVTTPAGSSLTNVIVPPVTGLSATASSIQNTDGSISSVINASWTTAGATVVFYEVKAVGPVTQIQTTPGTAITIGPLPNGTYTVSVISINGFGARSTEVF
ncbi:Tip attachment protein J [uncultured Caudovirales phage]|uniref:Tip attachment protein J n=1 Tax=uncultured Caudovirales phage TaxID=2100421 RepID=A0A6J5N780_9CAUD|nr:Tip attachment protein J [uncultured Caudovirales phage]